MPNSTQITNRYKRLGNNTLILQETNVDINQPMITTGNNYKQPLYEYIHPKYRQSVRFNTESPQKEAYRTSYKKRDFITDEYKPNDEGSMPDTDINRSTSERTTNKIFYEDKSINDGNNEFLNSFGSDEKKYTLYEIGDPDLLQIVRVQLYEKLTNPEGSIVWNDLIKGQKAR